ncbi:hypothetical protein [Haloarchaeobius salinus]|uniref:hypothetical protein n=1 Tax=Haloarchaeobius salinus TaxID=1198298 RepID=UPI002109DF30|nr:hypothetical protein [Haloarchaeobius salinus]
MDDPLVFSLPDSVFVAFDDEPTVADRRGARHAIDADDFAAFFRRYGVDIREADGEDVRSLGDLLSTLSWEDAEATTVPHPADADELAALTRLFLAYGAAGASLDPADGTTTYLDDDGLRATARRTADGCDGCTAAAVDQIGATYYEICDPHRRALYRRAVEAAADDEPDLDAIDVADCVDRLESDDDPTAAAAALARVAREEPGRVRPASDALFDVLDRLRADPFADEGPATAAVTALAGLATVDAETRTRLVELLDDDHAGVRRCAATAVGVAAEDPPTAAALVASEDDDGLLDRVVGGAGSSPTIERLRAMLDEESPGNRARALFALTELARDEPAAVAPVAEAIRAHLGDDDPDARFRAIIALGVLARHDSDLVGDALGRLRGFAGGEGPDADAATVALAYCLAGGLDVGTDRGDLRRGMRDLADPSRQPVRTVREAALALGAVGSDSDRDYLSWVRDCAGSPRVANAAERAARDLRERV